ncbi:PQQ-binding-like beta-propeller repeat protein [Streptomyces lavendulae]|uniref:outer membrane protein assembly factor BamB family protein n=1 Tax=Streptomyces lavendulae TaxID=1914 RepID=UPI003690007F
MVHPSGERWLRRSTVRAGHPPRLGPLGCVYYVLDAKTGTMRWSKEISGGSPLPKLTADILFLPLRPGIISALSTTDGSEKWHIQGDLSTLSVYDDKVVLADDDIQALRTEGRQTALDPAGIRTDPLRTHRRGRRPGEHRAQQDRTG